MKANLPYNHIVTVKNGKHYGQYRTELAVQDTYGQTSLTRQIFRQIV